MSRRGAALLALAGLLPVPAEARPAAEIRDAASVTYLHGMTAAIAEREAGHDAVPVLLSLLTDPEFPRHDNVVAFLAYLGGSETTAALRSFLDHPPAPGGRPEDARAFLLVPHALGRIAGRGDRAALDELLRLTEGRDGNPAILEASIAALALTGARAARDRLGAIADRRIVPDPTRPALASRARDALSSMQAAPAPAPDPSPAPAPAVLYTADTATRSLGHGISFVNHASLGNPMTTARLDSVLAEATDRAATGDYDGDVPCCIRASRSGAGGTFGALGDGLETIDSSAELSSVFSVFSGRAKVVTAINYCGGSGTNIIGCASTPGNSMVLVRLSSLSTEAILWLHEYGHNLGLGHAGDSRDIMYGSDNGNNTGLLPAECQAFHQPAGGSGATTLDIGACTNDGDPLADPIDNCPFVSNENQADADGDGIGDLCETCPGGGDTDGDGVCNSVDNCPGVANAGQSDADGDGDGDPCDNCPATANGNQSDADGDTLGDACDPCPADPVNDPDGDGICTAVDNCPATSNPTQVDFDADGYGDACETGALRADADLSGLVDGIDLARLGRAFGAVPGDSRYEVEVDLDRDGQIDGADLALLAPEFGKTSF